jgi:aminoglycoside/choline kinase family phosphotransferase
MSAVAPCSDRRRDEIAAWLASDLGLAAQRLEPASADASFRRYFRAWTRAGTRIVMDAPPDREDVRPYLSVARQLEQIGVHVPHVFATDLQRGFVLLEDLGSVSLLQKLKSGAEAHELYGAALAALANIQTLGGEAAGALPPYDATALEREMQLMPEWFLGRHLECVPEPGELALLRRTFDFLIAAALEQPQVFVHRDYHSRNLMVLESGDLGIIDFQDAVRGPVGYDLVSLLKDCYVAWPRARIEQWLRDYRADTKHRGLDGGVSEREFLRWFDLVGVQRHIKVLGIFARLWYRDGKPGYLNDLPLTLEYVRDASARYSELQEFARWLEARVVPHFAAANARALRGGNA